METYTARDGQSIYDVCLHTYGTFNQLLKLMKDNNISSINEQRLAGKVFIFDKSLVVDNSLFSTVSNNVIYATQEKYNAYLLQENRFYLLQENGFKILL